MIAFDSECYIEGQMVNLTFGCEGMGDNTVPDDYICVKIDRGQSKAFEGTICDAIGTPVTCKTQSGYFVRGIIGWRIEPCGLNSILGIIDITQHLSWLRNYD